MAYIELPDDLLRRGLGLDPAVEVDVTSLVDAVGRDGGTQGQLHAGGVWKKREKRRRINPDLLTN